MSLNFTEIDKNSRTIWRRSRDRIGDVLGTDSPKGRVTVTIPNYLTLFRLAVVPMFWYGFFSDSWWGAFSHVFDSSTGSFISQTNADEYYTAIERTSSPVPEPSSIILLLSGLITGIGLRKRYKW